VVEAEGLVAGVAVVGRERAAPSLGQRARLAGEVGGVRLLQQAAGVLRVEGHVVHELFQVALD